MISQVLNNYARTDNATSSLLQCFRVYIECCYNKFVDLKSQTECQINTQAKNGEIKKNSLTLNTRGLSFYVYFACLSTHQYNRSL